MGLSFYQIWRVFIAALLLLCLLRMPYWYYSALTIVATFSFVALAVEATRRRGLTSLETMFYLASALVFNPFWRPSLGRRGWNAVDVIAAIGLIAIVVTQRKRERTQSLKGIE